MSEVMRGEGGGPTGGRNLMVTRENLRSDGVGPPHGWGKKRDLKIPPHVQNWKGH